MAQQQKLLDDEAPFAREVVDVPVAEEMRESFLAYSLSVITSRAIPDVRDGLKPVQRRILYSMLQMGVRPDTPHRKSARIVGDTMGRYHPHGDTAIYDALVRMGQDFSRGISFVDPQGNFGSLDDPPAAPRYTECRLSEAAMAMVRELDEDTVDFRPTYDGESQEPVVLPALLPGLLLNGTTGIAVGMATNMPTHNLEELHAAIKLVMTKRRPKPTVDELLALCPGPDFPSGGIVVDDGIREAYEIGRGSIRIRARAEVESVGRSRQAIIVTELPYLVGPERIIAKLKELNESGRLVGVDDFKNLTDRSIGLRIQILVRKGHNPQAVLGELYKLTPLEETFGINNVVLVDGIPHTLGFGDLCRHYVDHRLEVLVRRSRYRLKRAEDRLHIVEGLLTALDAIDEVVAIIRGSKDAAAARKAIMKRFSLSQVQTDHILDMPLKRLTALEKLRIEGERDEQAAIIVDLKKLLKSKDRQRTTVLREFSEVVEMFGRPRRTEIVHPDDLPAYEATEVADDIDEPCVVTLSTSGQIGRLPVDGAKRATPGRHDVLVTSIVTRTTERITAITSDGRALQVLAAELGEATGRTRGGGSAQVFGTNRGEDIHTVVADGEEHLVLVTTEGVAKRLTLDEVRETKSGKTLMSLKSGDRVVAAFCAPAGIDIVIVASDGQVLRTPVDGISIQGRGAGGVAGMKLRPSSSVIGAGPLLGDDLLFTIGDDCSAKATPISDFESKGRGGVGIRVSKSDDGSALILARIGQPLGLLAVMAADDNPSKADPSPVPFLLEPSRRDLSSSSTERQVLDLGPARW
ncbi:MAG: DNA topoisomerase (ATP-hydrolyzing) [Actinomycetota bacterium]|nr:DNA topoisomerase (ATP-hydrolyzing) [Actinomycetota bacterium]